MSLCYRRYKESTSLIGATIFYMGDESKRYDQPDVA